jgi:hypothetical protein
MPARSNTFQETVDSILRLLAPKNASITQSTLVPSNTGGPPREIDVLIEYVNELGLPIRIAIEAKDYGRPISVDTVEGYIGKYNNNGGITVDKVVIVAAKFSKNAKGRANAVGFTLCTLNELPDAIEGTFTKIQSENGAWWLTRGQSMLGKGVAATLFDAKGDKVPFNARITGRKSKTDMGTVSDWAERLLKHAVGASADAIFAHFAGDMIHVLIDVFLSDHKATLGKKSEKLERFEFDFGKRLQMPDMEPAILEYSPEGGAPKKFHREIGKGLNSDVIIHYEKPADGPPQAIQVKVLDKNGKTALEKTFRGRLDL